MYDNNTNGTQCCRALDGLAFAFSYRFSYIDKRGLSTNLSHYSTSSVPIDIDGGFCLNSTVNNLLFSTVNNIRQDSITHSKDIDHQTPRSCPELLHPIIQRRTKFQDIRSRVMELNWKIEQDP